MLTTIKTKIVTFFRVLFNSVKGFMRHNCFTLSAAISFYALFSIIPLLFLLFSIMGFILGKQAWLFDRIIRFVKLSLPYLSDEILAALKNLISGANIYGWLGIIVLIWSAEFVMIALQSAMFHIFGGVKKKGVLNALQARVVGWAIFLIWSGVVLVSIGITTVADIIGEFRMVSFGIDLSYYLERSIIFKYFLPFSLMVIAVATVFKLMAGVSMRLRHALFGSIVFSLLWETAKYLFAWYISNFVSLSKLYGSLGALLVFLLWIYYSVVIFLFSSELTAAVIAEKGKAQK